MVAFLTRRVRDLEEEVVINRADADARLAQLEAYNGGRRSRRSIAPFSEALTAGSNVAATAEAYSTRRSAVFGAAIAGILLAVVYMVFFVGRDSKVLEQVV